MKVKQLFFNSLRPLQKLLPFAMLNKLVQPKLIFPFYHTVSDHYLPHIAHLYPIKAVNQFKQDLDFLLKHYQAISLTELMEGKAINKPSFLLSFDDGLSEFDQVIAPILLEKGIPAINFLNTAFIDNKTLFFRYKVSLLIEKLKQQPSLANALNKKNFDEAKDHLLGLQYNDAPIIDTIATQLEVDFSEFLKQQQPYLSSEQIRKLISKGFHFGAHSIDHPEYQYIPEEIQLQQTKESILEVKERFKLSYASFSFPFTDYRVNQHFFDELNKSVQPNYTFGSAGYKQENIHNHYQRIPFENNQFSAQEILKAEYFYHLLKKPLGKNLIHR